MGDNIERRGRKPGLTPTELEERNEKLITDRARGQSWSHLSSQYGLGVARCKEIYEGWRKQNPTTYRGRPAIEVVQQSLERLEAWIEQLADLASVTEGDMVKIAAINAQADKLQRATALMQETGILPKDLGTLRIEIDVQVLTDRLMRALNDNGASIELKRAILTELRAGGGSP